MTIKSAISTAQRVRRLAGEHPEWLPVLEAAAATAATTDEFAGAWVLARVQQLGGPAWVPNLRLLVTYGLLEKSGESTRGGRRAYYRMPDRAGVEDALDLLGLRRVVRAPRFIGAGASEGQPPDLARRAGDLLFEPRSWR